MKRRLALSVVIAGLAACIDFDAAREQCDQPGGRCVSDAGQTGGGTATTGGGGSTGGGSTGGGSSAGGGTATGGGIATGGGAPLCSTCTVLGACLPAGNAMDNSCGTGGVVCVNCAMSKLVCRGYVCEVERTWTKEYTVSGKQALNAVWVSPSGVVSAAGVNATLVQGSSDGGYREVKTPMAVQGMTGATINGAPSLVITGKQGADAAVSILPFDFDGGLPTTLDSVSASALRATFTAGTDVFVAGGTPGTNNSGGIWKWTGTGWARQSFSSAFGTVTAGVGDSTGLAFTTDDKILVYAPTGSSLMPLTLTQVPYAISAPSVGTVWFAGAGGLIGKANVSGTQQFDAGTEYAWYSIKAFNDSRVYVGGGSAGQGVIAEWDGVTWRRTTFDGGAINGLHGNSLDNLWAVDSSGNLWRLKQVRRQEEASRTPDRR